MQSAPVSSLLKWPELKEIRQIYRFKEDESDCVVDGEACQMIEDALYNDMISHTTSA